MKIIRTAVVALAALCIPMAASAADDYPSKPIRMVVGFAPGGVSDTLARLLAAEMQKEWGQSVIVENRAGASGIIGSDMVAKAAPDGYTLLLVPGTHTINPALNRELPYDSVKDFTPITLVASAPNVLVVRSDSPINSLKEYIAAAQAEPEHVTYATSGIGTTVHIAGERLAHLADIKLTHVPYKGSILSVKAVLSGEVQSSWSAVNSALPFIREGQLKVLAIASDKRSELLPDAPTLAESGIEGMTSDTWLGVTGPANMPPEVVDKLHRAYVEFIARDEMRQRLATLGADPVGMGPSEFSDLIEKEIAMFTDVVKRAGIQPE